jgi:lipopolysaccharide transport system permease protein
MDSSSQNWSQIISAKEKGYRLGIREIWRYRDLIALLVKRDLTAAYKQTILGPLWLIIQPLLTTITFTLIFGRFAKLSTDGVPPILFYLSGIIVWNYFSENLTKTSNTFITNAGLFGKVYFPRLVVPLSITISNLFTFLIQFAFFISLLIYYSFNSNVHITINILYLPLLLFILAGIGLSLGIIVSSLTTKYRDLRFLIVFGTQLFMFLTPVVYPLSSLSERAQSIMLLNPVASVIEMFKAAFLGTEAPPVYAIIYSLVFTLISLLIGIIIFNRVERSFMDTV